MRRPSRRERCAHQHFEGQPAGHFTGPRPFRLFRVGVTVAMVRLLISQSLKSLYHPVMVWPRVLVDDNHGTWHKGRSIRTRSHLSASGTPPSDEENCNSRAKPGADTAAAAAPSLSPTKRTACGGPGRLPCSTFQQRSHHLPLVQICGLCTASPTPQSVSADGRQRYARLQRRSDGAPQITA